MGRRIFFIFPVLFQGGFFQQGPPYLGDKTGLNVQCSYFTVLASTLLLIPPLGNLNVFLGNLIPPAPVSFPGHAWESSQKSEWRLLQGPAEADSSDSSLWSPGGLIRVGGPAIEMAKKTKGVAVTRRVRNAVKPGGGGHNCRSPQGEQRSQQPSRCPRSTSSKLRAGLQA